MHYYIYYNWRADGNTGVVHKATCGDCQSGSGKRSVKEAGKNGVWIGPFENKELADSFFEKLSIAGKECSHCIK